MPSCTLLCGMRLPWSSTTMRAVVSLNWRLLKLWNLDNHALTLNPLIKVSLTTLFLLKLPRAIGSRTSSMVHLCLSVTVLVFPLFVLVPSAEVETSSLKSLTTPPLFVCWKSGLEPTPMVATRHPLAWFLPGAVTLPPAWSTCSTSRTLITAFLFFPLSLSPLRPPAAPGIPPRCVTRKC